MMPMREIKIRIHLRHQGKSAELDRFDLEFVNDDIHDDLKAEDLQRFVANKVKDAMESFE